MLRLELKEYLYLDFSAETYTYDMTEGPALSRSLLRRAENTELSLSSLEAIAEIRSWLDQLESKAMLSAREKGATAEDIAEAVGLTTQAIYYRMRQEGDGTQHKGPGRPRSATKS